MNKENDMTRTLEKIRPDTTVAHQWPASARDAALERTLAATTATPVVAARSPRRRRALVTAALTVGLVSSGVGVAGATGVLPESFTNELSFWTTETDGDVDVETAQRVAQAPGPDGTVLSVWAATAANGTTCVSPLFEPPGELDRPAPTDFYLSGGECSTHDARGGFGNLGGSADERGIHTMWGPAGGAVTAELQFPDGTVRPALSAEDMFFFWYLADERTDPPVLVGYDTAGQVVETMTLPNLVTGTVGE
jgi:hypothetical protein